MIATHQQTLPRVSCFAQMTNFVYRYYEIVENKGRNMMSRMTRFHLQKILLNWKLKKEWDNQSVLKKLPNLTFSHKIHILK